MSLKNRTLFTAELQLIMCIQNAHECVFLISITREILFLNINLFKKIVLISLTIDD